MNWSAKGLIFENCMCTLVCPGHMHFSQLCTHERCKGYWALRFDDGGAFGAVSLRGLRAFIVFEAIVIKTTQTHGLFSSFEWRVN